MTWATWLFKKVAFMHVSCLLIDLVYNVIIAWSVPILNLLPKIVASCTINISNIFN